MSVSPLQPRIASTAFVAPTLGPAYSDFTLLRNSLVHILRMRRSIEVAHRQVQCAKEAAWESKCLLAQPRKRGF